MWQTAASDFVPADSAKSRITNGSYSSHELVAQESLKTLNQRHGSVQTGLLTTHAVLAETLAPFSVQSQLKPKDQNKQKTGIAVQDLETHLTKEKKA